MSNDLQGIFKAALVSDEVLKLLFIPSFFTVILFPHSLIKPVKKVNYM